MTTRDLSELGRELDRAPIAAVPDPDAREVSPDPPDSGKPPVRGHGEIYPGSPVTALGVYGETNYYIDVLGQLRGVAKHDLDKIRHLYGGRTYELSRYFPQFDKDGSPRVGKFDQASVATAMVTACDERGMWSPTNAIREGGAWCDEDGRLILHCGDAVIFDGEMRKPGLHGGKVYSAAPPVPRPDDSTARIDPASAVLELAGSWSWRRPDIDPQLVLGFICAQMLGGALSWRPVAWLTGDAATGKSEFQRFLKFVHGGDAGLLQAADATEAGVRSVVQNSSLPVALDEFEPDPDNPRKSRAVIELARRAASGGQIFRGSADQKGYQSSAFNCFLFSSILVPPMQAQDRSRLILLELDRLPEGAAKLSLDPRTLRLTGARLRHRLLTGWSSWIERLELWRAALARHGQTGRGADNYATILALADMAISEALPEPQVLDAWAEKLGKTVTDESVDIGSNAEDMVMHLLGQSYDVYRRGEQYTVAQWIMAAAQLPAAPADLLRRGEEQESARQANEKLAKVGLRVTGRADEARIFFPNKPIPGLCRLFDGSQWADGGWSQAARRLEGADAASLTLAGISTRGTYVPIKAVPGLLGFPLDRTSQRSDSLPDDATIDNFT